ncbi:hypothetical protein [Anaeromyxobacter sp. SG26]|uniref:hypothetical protein n=1 Tax=Anaeromyxobacter sp. SG26 TaxID=2925407 RepID=UPI001F59435C|nr:hypothetical protein [Anaeromyxobacter sp. SG26]
MIKVTIGDSQREFSSRASIEEGWINQQIEARRRDTGRDPCVRVHVYTPGVDVAFASAACGGAGGGGRGPNAKESSILSLWSELELGTGQLAGGRLVAFLKRAFGVIG